jgi:class 3 adenylate cyclase
MNSAKMPASPSNSLVEKMISEADRQDQKLPPNAQRRVGIRKTLLRGVFWRILLIEGILLIVSLIHRALTEGGDVAELAWYALRIALAVAIILLFMMVTLRGFLSRKIIVPLEAIASANWRVQKNDPAARHIELPEDVPLEIEEIVVSRSQMLNDILEVSEERLRLTTFIRDTFGRYLSDKVVQEILESPEGQKLGGRRETVTILMSDLRGFTSLSDARDPEEMVQLLNRYLGRMAEIILNYDGMIDEFIGDAILAIFGVPTKRQDDPARAVACGIAMQNALTELNKEIVHDGYPPLEMGIGINTGTVIVGNIGSEMRAKYGIVGTAVNIAARIESNTIGGQVLIGESTYQEVQDLVTTDRPRTIMMKGLKKLLVCYSVRAIGEPYHLKVDLESDEENGVKLSLPFHCWKVEDRKISSESMEGITISFTEDFISATVDPPLEPLTDVKLLFDFCLDAHCFDDIYAKVASVKENKGKVVNYFTITSISQTDKDLLRTWISEASQ